VVAMVVCDRTGGPSPPARRPSAGPVRGLLDGKDLTGRFAFWSAVLHDNRQLTGS
jgi:hypothetical protein